MVPRVMVVSLENPSADRGVGTICAISTFISRKVAWKMTSSVLPISTKTRSTLKSQIVNIITKGSLCDRSKPLVSLSWKVILSSGLLNGCVQLRFESVFLL